MLTRSTFLRLAIGARKVVELYYRLPSSRGEAYTDVMRIFLAGASGVIGQRLIPRLVHAGHIVGGLTRSHGKTELLRHLGAEPILCDVFDREALIQAVRDFKPDVMLNELTDLPDDAAQISQLANLNARIRTEGTRNLIEAARRSGSPKILAQSVAWQLPDGPDAQAVAELERSVLAEGGVVLRYGQFYGPGTYNEQQPPEEPRVHIDRLPNERWRRWGSQRASSSLRTESATAIWHLPSVKDHLRRGLARFKLCAHLLQPRSKLLNLLLRRAAFASNSSYLSMLFEKLVEQHRIHRS